MIIGPSRFGSAFNYSYAVGPPNGSKRQVHNFAYGPQPGDRILMRFAHEVIGVGQIPLEDEYQYSFEEMFACVYGWDLSHCRRVIWADKLRLGELASVYRGAKQKPTFTQVHEPRIVKMVKNIDDSLFNRTPKEMPQINYSTYSEEELGVELFRAGIGNKNIDDIVTALRQSDRLCHWYQSQHCGREPTENEVISHIILPLFLGLGWSHQQIAVEWKNVDMAFFKNTPTTEENCVLIIEAKGLGSALIGVLNQPIRYVNDLGLDNVKHILTTDGENLFMYEKPNNEWTPNPTGYINTSRLQKEYIIPKKTNLIDTLVKLQPSAF